MRLAVSKMSALRVVRALRNSRRALPVGRCALPVPSPAPRRRWSAGAIPWERLGLTAPPSAEHPVSLAVPSAGARVQAKFARCTIYDRGIPRSSHLDAGGGLFVPCPELLFLELAGVMSLPVHVLLGYELCGRFSRDARDPRTGPVTLDVEPATSVARIEAYLSECRWTRGLSRARRSLEFVADNAWSPMEAVLATLASLPSAELGYELGPVLLNHRLEAPEELVALGCRQSRVPDVLVAGTHVGFNYDGRWHFDSDDARAAREKYVDDLRRNRELMAMGLTVLPVTTEDLFAEGGLDAVMYEAALVVARESPDRASMTFGSIASKTLCRLRQELVWSLLPWDAATGYSLAISERERRAISRSHVEDVELVL